MRQQHFAHGFQLVIKLVLPVLKPSAIEKIKVGICGGNGNGQVVPVQIGDDPIVKFRHDDFLCVQFFKQPLSRVAALVVGELVGQRLVFDDEVAGFAIELLGNVVNLLQAVGFVIHRHYQIQRSVQFLLTI